jgi:hypothetical protein
VLQFHLPFFDLATEDLFVWSTDTAGGESAIKALLDAFCDRCDLQPEDGAILPIVTLNTGGYNHSIHGGFVHTPQLDIVGWTKLPSTPRPVLPTTAPPPELPTQTSLLLPDAPRTAGSRDGDGEIPFAPEWR